jgi:hypothetical protein
VSIYVKIFPYMFFIMTFNYCVGAALDSSGDAVTRIVAIVNALFIIALLLVHELIN